MTELDLLTLLLPILVPLLLGWGVVQFGIMAAEDARPLMTAFQYLFMPALLISCLAKESLADLQHVRYATASLVLLAALYGGMLFVHRVLLGRSLAESAMAAFVGVRFNTVALGLPLLTIALGQRAVVPVVMNVVLGYFTLLPLTLAMVATAKPTGSATGGTLRASLAGLRGTFANPMVLSVIVGLILAGFVVRLPGWADRTLSVLGNAAIAVPLVAVGMTLGRLSLAGQAVEVLSMSAYRVILSPTLAAMLAWAIDLPAFDSVALVLSFSLPTAKLAYAVAEDNGIYERQAAAIMALTTSLLPIVYPIWIWLCDQHWPGTIVLPG
jgi:predicted permease